MITQENINIQGTVQEAQATRAMHPHMFALWLFIVSIIMMFAAFTSAYIVRQAEGNWLYFDLPRLFWVNSIILIVSSATMHWSVLSAKKDNVPMLRLAISITSILGFAFLIGQYYAWVDLWSNEIFFAGTKDGPANPSGSFLYVLTGMHAVHLVSGIIFLIIALYSAFTYKIHSKKMNRIEMCATYWHFLDILWLYLFVFLLLNH